MRWSLPDDDEYFGGDRLIRWPLMRCWLALVISKVTAVCDRDAYGGMLGEPAAGPAPKRF
jgi:hypothetical protein